ncbi:acyl-CoA carboxylase subunit epsilon [Nocardioides sp.]|uniref:acyl-CoA carboxylase subunit epsilon n=1 Tax=Nocardioides sp. TaxID=35761 RepID=UPI0027326467|nr:acyl-CoA carboxylase subunit epsilon [Nocardioides sp.]MDP3893006.1 acyl-CoA carboxylase subunit epsilon [Nocardioides sp.]
MSDSTDEADAVETPPLLRVVNPDATAEEIAALVAVFSSLGSGEPPAPRRTPEWSANHRRLRAPLAHGAGGWRASALPR